MKKTVLMAVLLFGVAGCGPDLIVLDREGKPIEGALVRGVSLSFTGQSTTTDGRGYASIPWAAQPAEWVFVGKAGYVEKEWVPVDQKRPITITLDKPKPESERKDAEEKLFER